MTPFHVGMRVVCVDDDADRFVQGAATFGDLDGLLQNTVYTVRDVGICPFWGLPALWLCEINRPLCRLLEPGFDIRRFRPAHENRMDELRTLLAPVPSKELVQS